MYARRGTSAGHARWWSGHGADAPHPSTREPSIPLPPFSNEFVDDLARLGAAVLIGGIVGLNRELRRKPAGLRTHALVAIGSAVAMLSSVRIAETYGAGTADAVTRTVQGIIVGIGFLGGGVIVKTGQAGRVHNLTTAASIWVVACLGIVCGAGQWVLALGALVLTLIVLLVGGPTERMLRRALNPRGNVREPNDPDSHGDAT